MTHHFRANEITGHDCVPPTQTLGDTTHPVQWHSGPGMLVAEAPWSDVRCSSIILRASSRNCSASCHTANWFLPEGVTRPGPTESGHSILGAHLASNGVLPTCMEGSCGYQSLTAEPSPASCPQPDWDKGCNGHSLPTALCGRRHNSVQAPLHHKPTSSCSDAPSHRHRTRHHACHTSPLGSQPCARASTPDSPTCQIVQCSAAFFPEVPHRSLE